MVAPQVRPWSAAEGRLTAGVHRAAEGAKLKAEMLRFGNREGGEDAGSPSLRTRRVAVSVEK